MRFCFFSSRLLALGVAARRSLRLRCLKLVNSCSPRHKRRLVTTLAVGRREELVYACLLGASLSTVEPRHYVASPESLYAEGLALARSLIKIYRDAPILFRLLRLVVATAMPTRAERVNANLTHFPPFGCWVFTTAAALRHTTKETCVA